MHTKFHKQTLRTWRRRAAFKQKEVGKLIGLQQNQISRLESHARGPSLRVAIATEVLTGIPMRNLFPQAFEDVEAETLSRVNDMLTVIAEQKHEKGTAKRRYLTRALENAIANLEQQQIHEQTQI
jgi:transcriptional regulator with XRE-family HTH domain